MAVTSSIEWTDAAAGALLTACKAFQRAESLWGVDTRAFDEAFIEASQLADKALAFLRMPAPDAGAQEAS